jgi:Ca2+-binding EF-hand superfamily protein
LWRRQSLLQHLRAARIAAAALGFAILVLAAGRAGAYTAQEAKEVFDILDTNHDGKVTKLEFETNKIDAFYFRNRKNQQDPRLRFEETGLSRAFFDQADHGHKGYLTGLDLVDAIRFDQIDVRHRGYITFEDLVAGLRTISR